MTPLSSCPSPGGCYLVWSRSLQKSPSPSPWLPFSLSLSHRQLFSGPCTRAHTLSRAPLCARERAHAHTHTHTLPPATLHNGTLVQSACQLSIIHAGLEHRAARAASMISSSSSSSDRIQDDAPRRFCALGRHQLFPRCCLLGQPVSRKGRLAQNRALPLSMDDSCAPCLSPGNRGGEEGSAGDHNPCEKMAEDLFRVASPRFHDGGLMLAATENNTQGEHLLS